MIAGPAAMYSLGPCLAASRPNRVEKSTSNRDDGIPAMPAACSLYPSVPIRKMPWNVSDTYSAP